MNPLSLAVIQSGLIDRQIVSELQRWGVPIDAPEEQAPLPKSINEVSFLLEQALENEGLVATRQTDLDIVHDYLATQTIATLHVEVEGASADVRVVVGKTRLGDYIIPWKGDSIRDHLLNGLCYLTEDTSPRQMVFFGDVKELFFGRTQAFMLCKMSWKEATDGAA